MIKQTTNAQHRRVIASELSGEKGTGGLKSVFWSIVYSQAIYIH